MNAQTLLLALAAMSFAASLAGVAARAVRMPRQATAAVWPPRR
jgi:hypothetical protein